MVHSEFFFSMPEKDAFTLHYRRLRLSVLKACLFGIDVPLDLVPSLFSPDGEKLVKIIRKMADLNLTPSICEELFKYYRNRALFSLESLLEEFERNRPREKTRIYQGWGTFPPRVSEFAFLNSNIQVFIRISGDMSSFSKKFPLNAYATPKDPLYFPDISFLEKLISLSEGEFELAIKRLWRLSKIKGYLNSPRIHKCLREIIYYNSDKELKIAEKDATRRKRRDEIFRQLISNTKPKKVAGGYLLHIGPETIFYITSNSVFRLNYESTALKEAIYRCVVKGHVPKKLSQVKVENLSPETKKIVLRCMRNALREHKARWRL